MWPVILCVLSSLIYPSVSDQPRVLRPIRETGKDVGLFIVPGGFLEYHQYQALGAEIQQQVPLRLWIYLQDLFINGTYVSIARRELEAAGFPDGAPLYASGHSLGGIFLRAELGFAGSAAVSGMILLASELVENHTTSFPVPTLSITADLDGLLYITRPARQFSELEQAVKRTPAMKYKYPISLIHGINHGQFATEQMPERVLAFDLVPEQSDKRARELISDSVKTFMLYYTPDGRSDVMERSRATMDGWFESCRSFFQTVVDSDSLETAPDKSDSPWVRETQYIIADVPHEERRNVQVTVSVVHKDNFPSTKPELSTVGGHLTVRDAVTLSPLLNTLNMAADMLEAKMKSYESVQAALGLTGINDTAPVQCHEANRVAWQTVYNSAPDIVIGRLNGRLVKTTFLEDNMTSSADDWLDASLRFDYKDQTLQVQSPAYVTSVDDPDRPGMHYCKLLSPLRVAEFLYVDALRSGPTSIASHYLDGFLATYTLSMWTCCSIFVTTVLQI